MPQPCSQDSAQTLPGSCLHCPELQGQVALSPMLCPPDGNAVLGQSGLRTKQLLHCLPLLTEMGKALGSCWTALVTPKGGLAEELSCDTRTQLT